MYSKYKQQMLGQNTLDCPRKKNNMYIVIYISIYMYIVIHYSKYLILRIYSNRFEMKAVTVAQDLPYPGVSTQ